MMCTVWIFFLSMHLLLRNYHIYLYKSNFIIFLKQIKVKITIVILFVFLQLKILLYFGILNITILYDA